MIRSTKIKYTPIMKTGPWFKVSFKSFEKPRIKTAGSLYKWQYATKASKVKYGLISDSLLS